MDQSSITAVADAAGVIVELLTILGLVGAAVFAAIWLSLRSSRGRWQSAPAELVDGELRWMSLDSEFHSAPFNDDLDIDDQAELEIFYRDRAAHVYYPQQIAHDERTMFIAFLVLLGVAVAATIISVLLLLV